MYDDYDKHDLLIKKFTKAIDNVGLTTVSLILESDIKHVAFIREGDLEPVLISWSKDEDENTRLKRELEEARQEIRALKGKSKKSHVAPTILTKIDVVKKYVTATGSYCIPCSELRAAAIVSSKPTSNNSLKDIVAATVKNMFPKCEGYVVSVSCPEGSNYVHVFVQ